MKKLAMIVACLGTMSGASAMTEQEDNHPIAVAQTVEFSSANAMDIQGVLGALGTTAVQDLDYFTFFGTAGDVVTIDINGGIGGQQDVDTIIAVFGPAPNFELLRMNDDATTLDAGSTTLSDSRIENFTIPADGIYTVGVSSFPQYFVNGGGVYTTTGAANGDYTLTISGVTVVAPEPVLAPEPAPVVEPAPVAEPVALAEVVAEPLTVTAIQINIEVRPGVRHHKSMLNPRMRGRIPVAILSSETFDPMQLDRGSLTFGQNGDEQSLIRCKRNGHDVNRDRKKDLLCFFENEFSGFETGDLEAILRGTTNDGVAVEGRALLKVVPEKRRHRHRGERRHHRDGDRHRHRDH